MAVIACTLYEGNYHYGVAGLINSLYKNGYRGDFYIGYRGDLPSWAKNRKEEKVNWKGSSSIQLSNNWFIHFLPIVTDKHFANYKPDLLLQLLEMFSNESTEIQGIVYFDPDIVNKCEWKFYEHWLQYGIAVVHEIVWNDMPDNHPKRLQWQPVYEKAGYKRVNKFRSYINSGFIGLKSDYLPFLQMWKHLTQTASDHFNYDLSKFAQSHSDSDLFRAGDQDLLNICLMCTDFPVSEFGPEGMDFVGGGWLMSHSTGSPKPWQVNYFKQWIKGQLPTIQHKEYWKYANGILKPYPEMLLKWKILTQKITSFLGRFYGKN